MVVLVPRLSAFLLFPVVIDRDRSREGLEQRGAVLSTQLAASCAASDMTVASSGDHFSGTSRIRIDGRFDVFNTCNNSRQATFSSLKMVLISCR